MLEVHKLTKTFGGLKAVSDVSFSVGETEIVGIFGPNGSGKTTLLNAISGLLRPTSGTVLWNNRAIGGERASQIAASGIVKTFQNPSLFPEMTVREHLEIAGHYRLKRDLGWRRISTLLRGTVDVRDNTNRVLVLCRMESKAEVSAAELSYGEEKMLGVAMALMCDPELMLLDEPASGLGRAEIDNLTAVINDLRAAGRSLCIIDHRIGFLAGIADRAIALHHGAKIMEGTPQEVLNDEGVMAAYLGKKHA